MTLGDRLRSEGYAVDFAYDGLAGLEKAKQGSFDLIVLDIMLPLRNGLDVCTELRRAGIATRILLLTARSQTVEKVLGLKLGADDYVTKPFETLELMARIEALLRRSEPDQHKPQAEPAGIYRFGSIVLNVRRTQVTKDGEPITLTAREFQLLRHFAENQGVTFTRNDLLQKVWGHESGTLTRTVDVHVASLRQKLEQFPKKPQLIVTIPGIGYRFEDNSEPASTADTM